MSTASPRPPSPPSGKPASSASSCACQADPAEGEGRWCWYGPASGKAKGEGQPEPADIEVAGWGGEGPVGGRVGEEGRGRGALAGSCWGEAGRDEGRRRASGRDCEGVCRAQRAATVSARGRRASRSCPGPAVRMRARAGSVPSSVGPATASDARAGEGRRVGEMRAVRQATPVRDCQRGRPAEGERACGLTRGLYTCERERGRERGRAH